MENRERYKRIIMFLSSVVIVAIETALFAYIWYNFYLSKEVIGRLFVRGNQVVIGLYVLMLYFFYKIYGGFKVGYLRVFEVIYSQILSVVCVNFITYLQLCLIGRWRLGEHLTPMLAMTGIDLIIVVIWVVGMRFVYTRLYPPRQMLMVYGEHNPGDLRSKLETREDKYAIKEMVPISLGLDAIKEKICGYKAVVIGDIPSHERNVLLKYCFEKDIRCYSIPKLSDIMLMSSEEIHLFDTTLLLCRNRRLTVEQQAAKRLMDVIVSAAGVVIASPIMLLIAVLIKAYDGGPVFYRQVRVTQYGREFRIFKFRTMVQNADRIGSQVTVSGDSRITRVGKVIRSCRLDEIGQLLNVLGGSMSFVGTRPEVPKYVARYTPEMMATLLLPAGVTSEASIRYKDEAELLDKAEDVDETYVQQVLPGKMAYNLASIRRFGLGQELLTMLRTVKAVL